MIVEFNMILHVFVIVVLGLIAGIPFAIWFLSKSKLRLFEKTMIGLTLGILLPPFVSFLTVFFGIHFSVMIPWISTGIVFLIGLGLVIKDRKEIFEGFKLSDMKRILDVNILKQNWKSYVIPIFLLLILFLAFWIRFQSWSPVYQELDPYYYMYGARQILVQGMVPLTDDTAWYPLVTVSHRGVPVLHYMFAHWYVFTTGSTEYNNYYLSASC
ncbi:MAG: hypothetical protein J7K26_02700, partial [Candidatus Aenigmarchaeota archaeon]|nr:hypothetical protein [Candidatus Aenigmarchaeota archaeon]